MATRENFTAAQPGAQKATNNKKRWAFYITLAVGTTVMVALFGTMAEIWRYIVTAWTLPDTFIHRFHEVLFSGLMWVILGGLLIQFWKPERRAAAMQQVLAIVLILVAVVLTTFGFFPPPIVLLVVAGVPALLHPAGRRLLRLERPNGWLLGLVAAAAIPLVAFASDQIGLQLQGGADDAHAAIGHWALMAVYALSIISTGLLGSFRKPGWRVPAWSTGLLALLLGAASIVMQEQASSVGALWGGLAIAWGVSFVAAAELTRRPSRA